MTNRYDPDAGTGADFNPFNDALASVNEPCNHGVTFDQRESKGYTIGEVRQKFPRLDGKCPKGCGFEGISYASMAHFIYGDW